MPRCWWKLHDHWRHHAQPVPSPNWQFRMEFMHDDISNPSNWRREARDQVKCVCRIVATRDLISWNEIPVTLILWRIIIPWRDLGWWTRSALPVRPETGLAASISVPKGQAHRERLLCKKQGSRGGFWVINILAEWGPAKRLLGRNETGGSAQAYGEVHGCF